MALPRLQAYDLAKCRQVKPDDNLPLRQNEEKDHRVRGWRQFDFRDAIVLRMEKCEASECTSLWNSARNDGP